MFEFLLKLTHKKPCKKEKPCCEQKQEQIPAENRVKIPEEIVAQIDYEKLADAIVEANERIEKKKKEKEQEEYKQQKENWQIALLGKKLEEGEKQSNWQTFLGLMFFNKKNATGDNAIHALLKIINCSLLLLYECALYALSALSAIYLVLTHEIITAISKYCPQLLSLLKLPTKNTYIVIILIILIIFPLIIARIIRIARLQIDNCKDNQFVITVFNSLITFTALIIAIITMIMTTCCGGT